MKTSQEIRQQFIDFFVQKHAHTFVPSSPVVPLDDPTLLFTNAGMNQFKPIFLGQEKRSYTRAVNTQKCIRAGGKHNDLDDVGRSRRHHTFFEMLGNWSFGDYFKRGAIEMAWELLTKVWKLDPTRLHVSCFQGDEANGVPRDTEAANLWKEIAGIPDDHIHYFGADNFWEMGDTGPCGPCSEIYIDRTPDKTGGPEVNGNDPRVMEIWNLVFIQYNRNADRSLTPLPAQHVDTGMGFERITQVLQNVQSNYEIDLFHPFWAKLKELSGFTYTGLYPPTNAADPVAESANPQLRYDIAFRVIADHIRCLTFALTDGAVPSNEGRGYVLRRILRRAVRFGRQQLELKEPFLHKLVPVVVEAMGGAFPELKKNPQRVVELVKEEENSFGRTLDRGLQLFERAAQQAHYLAIGEAIAHVKRWKLLWVGALTYSEAESDLLTDTFWRINFEVKKGEPFYEEPYRKENWPDLEITEKPRIRARAAFTLHDTYGFPIDLTRIMAEERGMTVDLAGYEKLMEQAREIARSGGKTDEGKKLAELPPAVLADLAATGAKPTDDSPKYSAEPISAQIVAIWNGSDLGSSPVDAADDEQLAIILDRTNFYAEMGGQVGDTGTLTAPTSLDLGDTTRASASIFDVESTKTVGGYVLHIGRLRSGKIAVGEKVTATVAAARNLTQQNHTTTHLANWALREVLGSDVQQKGSLVDPEKLRFDFSHGKSLNEDELGKVETLVNQRIAEKLPVYAETAPQEKALKIHGLRAVFGEKYPPMVRVVSVGVPVAHLLADPANEKWQQFSIEFCGGTHLKNSSDAECFVITAEESVSKGIRRIVALTGPAGKTATEKAADLDRAVTQALSASEKDIPQTLSMIQKLLGGEGLPLRAKRRAQTAVADLQSKYKAWEKTQRSEGPKLDLSSIADDLISKAADHTGAKTIVSEIQGATNDQILGIIDSIRKRIPSHGILLAGVADGKINFVSVVSDDLIAKGLKAGDWVKEAAKITGGGGGGRPNMAQAGGKDPAKLPDALAAARAFVEKALK
jgi:alanyl-tRNA synthetase